MLGVLAVFLLLLAGAEGLVIWRGARRLLEFDDFFQTILPVLDEYGDDLTRMASADLDGILVDHPEVLTFHRRNLQAKEQVKSLADRIANVSPRKPKKVAPELPRPEAE